MLTKPFPRRYESPCTVAYLCVNDVLVDGDHDLLRLLEGGLVAPLWVHRRKPLGDVVVEPEQRGVDHRECGGDVAATVAKFHAELVFHGRVLRWEHPGAGRRRQQRLLYRVGTIIP